MSKPDGGPAFPPAMTAAPDGLVYTSADRDSPGGSGLSMRDWFAGMAMQGMYQSPSWDAANYESIATYAYRMADAMLKERES